MAMSRSNFPALLVEGLREVFGLGYAEQKLVYPKIFEIHKSKKQKETDQSVTGLGMLSAKDEGTPISYDDMIEGYATEYVHTTYGKGVRVTEELLEDELYGVIEKRVKALGRSARYRKEYDHASFFNYLHTTTLFTGGDAVAIASTSHPRADGGTVQDNYNASTALSLTSLETAMLTMRGFKDDRGLLISVTPKYLLIPPALEFDAYEILNSNGKPYTADNEVNFFRGKLDVIVWDQLTDTTCWGLLSEKDDGAPISFDRRAVTFKEDGDFDSGDGKVKCTTRYSFGASDWRWVVWQT